MFQGGACPPVPPPNPVPRPPPAVVIPAELASDPSTVVGGALRDLQKNFEKN